MQRFSLESCKQCGKLMIRPVKQIKMESEAVYYLSKASGAALLEGLPMMSAGFVLARSKEMDGSACLLDVRFIASRHS